MLKFIQLIPFYPLFQMIRVQVEFGFILPKKWKVLLIWFVKLIIVEPFRMVEALVMIFLPEKKVQPIFIIGYYRSGTTYLQELLSADKNHRTLTLFQSVLPEVSLCFAWFFLPVLSAITRAFKIKNNYHDIPFSWTFPGEEDVAINAMMAMQDYNRIYQYPSKYKIIKERFLKYSNAKNADKWMANYKYLLKKLAYKSGNRQLILKSPPNMGRIKLLKNEFPDAKFIFIHRDPFESIQSAKRLWELNRSFSFEEYSNSDVDKILIDQYQCFYELFKADSEQILSASISFESLVNDSTGTMEFIYKKLETKGWEEAIPLINSIVMKRRKERSVKPSPEIPMFLQESNSIKAIRAELGYD